jgi:DNA-binding NtrC family response regulator
MNKANLLLVDDEKGIINEWKRHFSTSKFNIFEAYSGEEALKKLDEIKQVQNTGPLIVLLDVVMEGLNGLDVLARIKGEFPFSKIYIITGNVATELIPSTAYETGKLGGDGFFEKMNVDFDKLKRKIDDDLKIQETQLSIEKKKK